MPVPKFEEFFLPVLKFFDDDEIHTKVEVSKYMVEYFNLNEEELNERTSSGNSLRYKDRTGWAVDYLYRATLLDRVERGKYIISDEGKNVLKMDLENIDNNFLLGYDSFKEFQNVSTTKTEVKYEKEVLSPSDRINEALLEINNNLSSNLLEEIFSRDSDFFEKLVVDLLLKMGYGGFREEAGVVTKKTNDGGIDGIINEDILGLDKIAIQAKRHENTISRPDLQKFSGALSGMGIKKGVFITTSNFSNGAIDYVKQLHDTSIVLIDGNKLANLMIKFDLGTSTKEIYYVKDIDMDYFTDYE